jgi:quinol monooxygenase YgiN
MHVRITRGRFDSARAEEIMSLTAEVAEAIRALPGFVSYQGGVNTGAGTLVAISTWENEEAANFPREKLGDVVARVVEIAELEPADIFEVVITA